MKAKGPALSSSPLVDSAPRASFLLGHLPEFGRDPLGFLSLCAREHGDWVPLRFINQTVWLLNDASQIEVVLSSQNRNFRKTAGYRTPFMRRLFGQGLLTSEGDFWLRQRRLAQPAFHRDRINNYAKNVVGFAEKMVAGWRPGETRDIHQDMMRLTTEVVTKSLFNSEVPPEIDEMSSASAVVMEQFTSQRGAWRLLLPFLPTPGSIRFERVMRRLDAFIHALIRERRASGQDTGDLLSMLLQARDEDGSGMTDRQLRDELTTLMVAGLDTTALALSWSFHLLSRHPEIEAKLCAGVREALGGENPSAADLPRLSYAEMVIKETLRLYPPGWIIGRELMNDCEIGGRRLKAGSSIIMSQWLKHRDPRHFENPDQFIPERWEGDKLKGLPKFAYFPFGGGPRICIGAAFAMLEAVLVLAVVTRKFRLSAVPGREPVPWAAITLQPRGGVHLKVEAR